MIKTLPTLWLLASLPSTIAAGAVPARLDEAPESFRAQFRNETFSPGNLGSAPDLDRPADWQTRIDTLWGPGPPTEVKLRVFDTLWDTIDREYACFQDLKTDWNEIRERYRGEIASGVSRGRFAAILNHMALATRESHTQFNDPAVNSRTALDPGVPLMVIGSFVFDDHFGACLTPLPDGSLLVYEVRPGHPLGLVRGDRVLGYEGVPWRELARRLLELELPVVGFWGSSSESFDHALRQAAGLNWHLFETIDVVKHASGVTLSLPTALLDQTIRAPFCTEQIEPPGVRRPDVTRQRLFSWGVIEGTKIGYIYGFGWFWDAEQEFLDAVRYLMFDADTDGLIIDFRTNFGGNMFLSNPALSLLFREPVATIGFAGRADPADHFAMEIVTPPSVYVIPGDPASYYDRPIAVLTGPGAVSSGDQVAYRMTFHPQARIFGKTTATAFNAPSPTLTIEEYTYRFAAFDAFPVSDPDEFLTHDEFPVDMPVWLGPDGAASGVDGVVRAAMCWIVRSGLGRPDPSPGSGGIPAICRDDAE